MGFMNGFVEKEFVNMRKFIEEISVSLCDNVLKRTTEYACDYIVSSFISTCQYHGGPCNFFNKYNCLKP